MNNAAVNMEMQISLPDGVSISVGHIPRKETAVSYRSSIFNFLRNLHIVLNSTWTNLHAQMFISGPFLHVFVNTDYFLTFENNHSNRCEVIFHSGFDLHSLMIEDVEHFLICLLTICMFSLEKMSIQFLCPFFKFDYFARFLCF